MEEKVYGIKNGGGAFVKYRVSNANTKNQLR